MTPELLFVGLATADLLIELPRWPDPDDRLVVDGLHTAGGGPAATAAVAAARLGRRVAFCGAIGNDSEGQPIRDGLTREGVDTALLLRRPGETSRSIILLPRNGGSRSILHVAGTVLDALPPAAAGLAASAGWIHVDHAGWPLAGALPRERVSVDAGNPIPGLELEGVGIYAPTAAALRERYPGRTLGAAVRAALDEGARRVAVTLGRDGALAADADGAWRVRTATVEIRSTLGAGDVFHGALLAGLVAGEPLPAALRGANLVAAMSCRALDGRTAIPTTRELAERLPTAPVVEPILLEELR